MSGNAPARVAGAADAVPATPPPRRGRFAPSPTGPLHFGSLIAALGSFLCARHADSQWLVRIEDIDPPREMPGAADAILETLEHHGLEWDGPLVYQSRRTGAYEAALEQLRADGWLYECSCTRREITARGRHGPFGPVYPGTCRNGPLASRKRRSLRVRTLPEPITFRDYLQGPRSQCLPETSGDFVVRRADGLYAYQLAVVVDDAEEGITDVVRGADLLESTPRQIHLQRLLKMPTPSYLHLPVAVDDHWQKLSKQTHAAPLDNRRATANLWQALAFLGHRPPAELRRARPGDVLTWALASWRPERLPHCGSIRPGA